MDKAGKHAHMLLLLDSDHALANYIIGSIQLQKGDLLLAEDSMRTALVNMRSPAILNDLAWVLQLLKKYDEAETLIREAIKANDKFAGAYDTLGVILMKSGNLAEAETMLNQALVMMNGHPDVLFNLAELHEKTGAKTKLARDIKRLDKVSSHLTDEQRELLEKIKSSLK